MQAAFRRLIRPADVRCPLSAGPRGLGLISAPRGPLPPEGRSIALTAELDAFWQFVSERDAIWQRRHVLGLHEPWTSDPILQKYHVTNVHRHKDPGTQWIVKYVRDRFIQEPLDVLFTVYAYRSLNRLQTFERFGLPNRDGVSVGQWLARLHAAHDEGVPLGSKRHLTFFARLERRLPKLVDAYDLADAVWRAPTGVDAIKALIRARIDVGPFLGTQVVADLVTIAPAGLTIDRNVRVPVSGGSRYGLGLIEGTLTPAELARHAYAERTVEGRATRQLTTPPEETAAMERLLATQPTDLSEPLTWLDLEHACCEWSRYHRLAMGDLTRRNYLLRDRS